MCARLNVLHKTLEVVTDPLSSCLKNDADFCSLVLMIFFFSRLYEYLCKYFASGTGFFLFCE